MWDLASVVSGLKGKKSMHSFACTIMNKQSSSRSCLRSNVLFLNDEARTLPHWSLALLSFRLGRGRSIFQRKRSLFEFYICACVRKCIFLFWIVNMDCVESRCFHLNCAALLLAIAWKQVVTFAVAQFRTKQTCSMLRCDRDFDKLVSFYGGLTWSHVRLAFESY